MAVKAAKQRPRSSITLASIALEKSLYDQLHGTSITSKRDRKADGTLSFPYENLLHQDFPEHKYHLAKPSGARYDGFLPSRQPRQGTLARGALLAHVLSYPAVPARTRPSTPTELLTREIAAQRPLAARPATAQDFAVSPSGDSKQGMGARDELAVRPGTAHSFAVSGTAFATFAADMPRLSHSGENVVPKSVSESVRLCLSDVSCVCALCSGISVWYTAHVRLCISVIFLDTHWNKKCSTAAHGTRQKVDSESRQKVDSESRPGSAWRTSDKKDSKPQLHVSKLHGSQVSCHQGKNHAQPLCSNDKLGITS